MVKVLENQLIDLDLMPGQKPSDLLAKAKEIESQSPEKAQAMRQLAAQKAAGMMEEVQRKTSGVSLPGGPGNASEEQPDPNASPEEQQKAGGIVGGVKGVGMGLTNTVGSLSMS